MCPAEKFERLLDAAVIEAAVADGLFEVMQRDDIEVMHPSLISIHSFWVTGTLDLVCFLSRASVTFMLCGMPCFLS